MSERLAATTTTTTACMARACAAPHAPFNQRSRHQREKMEPLPRASFPPAVHGDDAASRSARYFTFLFTEVLRGSLSEALSLELEAAGVSRRAAGTRGG